MKRGSDLARGSLARFVVVAVVVAALAVPLGLVGVATIFADRNGVEQQVARGQQLATTAATLIGVARDTGSAADLDVLRAFLRAVVVDDVGYVVIVGADGEVVAAEVQAGLAAPMALKDEAPKGSVVVEAEVKERDRTSGVEAGIGRVLVGLQRPTLPWRALIAFALVAVIAAIIVAVVVVSVLRRRALRPLSAVTAGLSRVAAGESNVDVDVHSGMREIEDLVEAFDALVHGGRERGRLVARLEQGMGAQLARDHGAFDRAPQQQHVAVLFVDVRDFTPLQAALGPELALSVLDRLLSGFVAVVERHGGHVERFLGDGLVALFGAPDPMPDAAARATACAVDLEVVARRLGEAEKDRVPRFVIGVGVAAGTALVGAVGPPSRRVFAAFGEVPALARRVQQEAKSQSLTVLVTEDVFNAARDHVEHVRWKKLPPMVVRGVGMPLSLYRPSRDERRNDDVTTVTRR
ncbi:MAG TPA: adenylate/guanylate cyclase domain-containing protein [Myxococcota bacterium]